MFSLKQSWFIGLIASILVGIWEFLLHYSPKVLEIGGSIEFLAAVPVQNLVIWHFFVLVWIPLYFIGYYHLYLMLRGWGEKMSKLFFCIWILAFLCWGIWIASRGFIGQIVHMKDSFSPEMFTFIESQYLFYFENLLNVLRYLIFVVSGLFIYLISTWKTNYPKLMILFNPILLLLLVFISLAVPMIWKFLVPIALNVAHFVLFSVSLYFLLCSKKNEV
jgi:hypothetical protein